MDGHDRAAAFAAFEAALALSPSSALTYILGAAILSWAGEAERAIEWGEQALRLSPFDPWKFIAYRALALAHFLRGRYQAAADAGRRAVQFNPGFGSSHMLLAAPLAKLGRYDEAKAAVARLMEREPAFRLSRQFAGVDCAPALAASLSEALRPIGLPE
jgi:tetratricopeptide (TPR) repeat protein